MLGYRTTAMQAAPIRQELPRPVSDIDKKPPPRARTHGRRLIPLKSPPCPRQPAQAAVQHEPSSRCRLDRLIRIPVLGHGNRDRQLAAKIRLPDVAMKLTAGDVRWANKSLDGEQQRTWSWLGFSGLRFLGVAGAYFRLPLAHVREGACRGKIAVTRCLPGQRSFSSDARQDGGSRAKDRDWR
jgi:hypothetical protein